MTYRNQNGLKLADPTHHSPEREVEVEPDWRPPEELRRDDLRLEDVRRRDHRHHEDEGADVADLGCNSIDILRTALTLTLTHSQKNASLNASLTPDLTCALTQALTSKCLLNCTPTLPAQLA